MDPKEIIKALPSYLNFAIRLLRWPPDALKPYRGTGKVASVLVGSLLTGIGVSYVIVLAIGPARIADDPSWLVQRIKEIGNWLPVVAVVVVSILTIIFHILTGVLLWFQDVTQGRRPSEMDAHLGGKMEDSVNAALAFASVFAPVLCAAVLLVNLLVEPGPNQSWAIPAIIAGVPSLFAVVYFPWCLAGTHPDATWIQAFAAWSMTLVFAYILGAAVA